MIIQPSEAQLKMLTSGNYHMYRQGLLDYLKSALAEEFQEFLGPVGLAQPEMTRGRGSILDDLIKIIEENVSLS